MLKKLAVLLAFLAPLPAVAQSVQQSGTVTRLHLPYWVSSGVVADGGTSADSPISSIGATGEGTPAICASSQRANRGAERGAVGLQLAARAADAEETEQPEAAVDALQRALGGPVLRARLGDLRLERHRLGVIKLMHCKPF